MAVLADQCEPVSTEQALSEKLMHSRSRTI